MSDVIVRSSAYDYAKCRDGWARSTGTLVRSYGGEEMECLLDAYAAVVAERDRFRDLLEDQSESCVIAREERDALALLDAGRKDRERVEEALVIYHHAFVTGSTPPVSAQVVAREYLRQHRTAIDQARGK